MRRLLILVVASALSGCGGDDDGAAGTTTSTTADTTTTSTTTTVTTTAPACSAAGLDGEPESQPGLPAAVAEVRDAIAAAATDCDFERLEELAADRFTYSFGDGGSPAAHWRRQEAEGRPPEPLRFLVELLDRLHGTVESEGSTTYVWPSAFAHDDWADVPAADRDALRPLYGEEDFEFFERFGGYVGYRVGITEGGDWVFFVAGD